MECERNGKLIVNGLVNGLQMNLVNGVLNAMEMEW
jgi:hypothetical protein